MVSADRIRDDELDGRRHNLTLSDVSENVSRSSTAFCGSQEAILWESYHADEQLDEPETSSVSVLKSRRSLGPGYPGRSHSKEAAS